MREFQYVMTVKSESQDAADVIAARATVREDGLFDASVTVQPLNRERWVWVHATGEEAGQECMLHGVAGRIIETSPDAGICDPHDRRVAKVFRDG